MTFYLQTHASLDLIMTKLEVRYQQRGLYRTTREANRGMVRVTVLRPRRSDHKSIEFTVKSARELVLLDCTGLPEEVKREVVGSIACELGSVPWGIYSGPPLTSPKPL